MKGRLLGTGGSLAGGRISAPGNDVGSPACASGEAPRRCRSSQGRRAVITGTGIQGIDGDGRHPVACAMGHRATSVTLQASPLKVAVTILRRPRASREMISRERGRRLAASMCGVTALIAASVAPSAVEPAREGFTLRVGYQPYYAEAWAGGVVRAMSADETPLRLSVESPQGRCRRSVSRPATRALRTVGTRAVQSRARLRASRASALLRTAPTAQHQGAEQSRTEERQRAGLGDLGKGRGHLKARVERAGE